MEFSNTPIKTRHEAEVISIDDPDGLMRVQVRVYGMFDGATDGSLPWATYLLPIGFRHNDGDFTPCVVGDVVWVEFPYVTKGKIDTRRPLITGSVHFCPSRIPNMPHEAFGGSEKLLHTRPAELPAAEIVGINQSKVHTQNGTTIEWLSGGAWRIINRATGSFIEITKDGSITSYAKSNTDNFVGGNDNKTVVGDRKTTVAGTDSTSASKDRSATVGGNCTETISGNKTVSASKVTMTASGDVIFNGAKVILNGGKGVVTGECICALTGLPHSDFSALVMAGK